jgi:hypothetical protein
VNRFTEQHPSNESRWRSIKRCKNAKVRSLINELPGLEQIPTSEVRLRKSRARVAYWRIQTLLWSNYRSSVHAIQLYR